MKGEPLVLAFAAAFPAAMAYVYFVALSPAVATDPGANPLMQTAYAAGKVLQFSLPVLWLAVADRSALRPRTPSLRGVGLGIAFGVGVALLALGLFYGFLNGSPPFQETPARLRSKLAEFGLTTPAGYWLLASFIAIAHSLLEEYYWRWFVYGRLRRHLSQPAALAASALAFTGHHVFVLGVYFPGWFWAAVVPFALAIATGGVFWAWFYERSGSLLGPWLSHVIVDSALMGIGYDLIFHH